MKIRTIIGVLLVFALVLGSTGVAFAANSQNGDGTCNCECCGDGEYNCHCNCGCDGDGPNGNCDGDCDFQDGNLNRHQQRHQNSQNGD